MEILNIISETYCKKRITGPNKVIINTIKGLKKIGYPFVINRDIRDYRYNWIHDSSKGIIEAGLRKIPAVIGPNVVVLPNDLWPLVPFLSKSVYLHPSPWCVDVWKKVGFSGCPLYHWPVGIDTDDFNIGKTGDSLKNVMVYLKNRDNALFEYAVEILKKAGFNPYVIKYGEYNELQYKDVLSRTCFGVWIGISESQGIALQEALSANLPLIVCNVQSLFEGKDKKGYRFPPRLLNFKPTSAPYFDKRCGIIIEDIRELGQAVKEISDNLGRFKPREYILENLSLEKQALELLSFFNYLKIDEPKNPRDYNQDQRMKDFKLSFTGNLYYSAFIFRRKTKTVIRLIRDRLIK